MELGIKRLHCFFAQVAVRLAIHKSLPKSQASFDLFSNLSICLIRANASPKSVQPYRSVFDVYFMPCKPASILLSILLTIKNDSSVQLPSNFSIVILLRAFPKVRVTASGKTSY